MAKNQSKGQRTRIIEAMDFPGTYSFPKPQQIPRGAAQQALDFLTRDTWVELRPGYHPLGIENDAVGKVLSIKTAHRWDGTEIIYKATLDGKLSWYDPLNTSGQGNASKWSEVGGIGANLLAGAAAANAGAGEKVYMDEYNSPSGTQLWVGSPHSGIWKIMTANPGSAVSQYNVAKNFKGRLRIIQSSMFMWHYVVGLAQAANAVLQRSYVDSQNFTTVTSESETLSALPPASVSGTLASISGTVTCFAIQIAYTDTLNTYSENFTDDFLGNLIGSNGGTGSINYATGAFVLTPNQAPGGTTAASATYETEDSTNGGIADFTKSGTRLAGQGVSWVQTAGGDILGVNPYNGSFYVLHQRNAWIVTVSSDDTSATNVIYRDNMFLASESGSLATPDGVYYIDDHGFGTEDPNDVSKPFISLLSYNPIASQVLPVDLSSGVLDLSGYSFDQCVAFQALDWIFFFCRTSNSPINNRVIAYNYKLSSNKRRIFDILSYPGNCATLFAAQMIAGDVDSNNAWKLLDGYDDDGGTIQNATWLGNADDHGLPTLKKTKKLWIEGFIAVNQSVDVYVQLDAGSPIKVGTISGKGDYVDTGISSTIGSLQIGVYPIGGPDSVPVAYHYIIQITINSSWYQYFTIGFLPTGIGYFSFQKYANYDIRVGKDKLPLKYRNFTEGAALQSSAGGATGTLQPYILIYRETPAGLINGTNTVYTVQHAINFVFNFEINGEQIDSSQYSVDATGLIITFNTPLPADLSGTPFEIVHE
jgi:hypothetical protein